MSELSGASRSVAATTGWSDHRARATPVHLFILLCNSRAAVISRLVMQSLSLWLAVATVCSLLSCVSAAPVLSFVNPSNQPYSGNDLTIAAGLPVTIVLQSSVAVATGQQLQIRMACPNTPAGPGGFVFSSSSVFTFGAGGQSASILMTPPMHGVAVQICVGVMMAGAGGDPAFVNSSMPSFSFAVDSPVTFGKPLPGGYTLYYSLTEGYQPDKQPNTSIVVGEAFLVGWVSTHTHTHKRNASKRRETPACASIQTDARCLLSAACVPMRASFCLCLRCCQNRYYDSHADYLDCSNVCELPVLAISLSCRLNDEVAFFNSSLSYGIAQAPVETGTQYNTPLRPGTVRCAFKWVSGDIRFSVITLNDLVIPLLLPELALSQQALVVTAGTPAIIRLSAQIPAGSRDSYPVLLRSGSSVNVSVSCTTGTTIVLNGTDTVITNLILTNDNEGALNFTIRPPPYTFGVGGPDVTVSCNFSMIMEDYSATTGLTPDMRYTYSAVPAALQLTVRAPLPPPPTTLSSSSATMHSSTAGSINHATKRQGASATTQAIAIAAVFACMQAAYGRW